jgi:ribonuclease D
MPRLTAPSKSETALLEPFPGLPLERIFVPRSPADHERAVAEIVAAGVAGFDTESKPTFKAGEVSGGPHVVQLALADRAFLFQLHREGAMAAVRELLQSNAVKKVGFGLKSDHGQIRRRLGIQPQAVVDIDAIFRKSGYRGQIGVRAAVAVLLQRGFTKSKSTTTSNWAAHDLSPRQRLYAANDAYAALMVWEALQRKEAEHPETPRPF